MTNLALLNDTGSAVISKTIVNSTDSISYNASAENYFIRITGSSSLNPNFNSYSFTANLVPAIVLNLKIAIEGMWDGSVHAKDTVKVYLRNNISPFNKIDSAKVYLDSTGSAAVNFIHVVTGNYYLQTAHRNSIETWSSGPVELTNGIIVNYNFKDLQSRAYGNNLIFKSGKYCIYSGDVNQNKFIDASDLSEVENDAANSLSGYVNTDLTGDMFVDGSDLSIVENNAAAGTGAVLP